MYQVLYQSKASLNLSETDIENILHTANNYNNANDITGCLLYNDGIFLQILEGEEETVQKLYEKILKDNRHTNIELLESGHSSKRSFSKWGMAYKEINNKQMAEVGEMLHYQLIKNMDKDTANNSIAIRIFQLMAKKYLKK